MNARARASTGTRLEAAARAAAREAAARRASVATEHLEEIELLLSIAADLGDLPGTDRTLVDRKSTRLNSSHGYSSYAGFCLKKKNCRRRRGRLLRRARTAP